MHWIDWTVVVSFMVGLLVLGAKLAKRAGSNTDEFILAGRKMPWWLAGASVLATGLNASTMLSDSRKIRQDGLGGLWFTWRSIFTMAISSVFFVRLWRRAAFVTQMEFYHARYHGRGADVARTFDSVLYGIIVAAMWAAIGLVGMKKVVTVLLGLPPDFLFLGMTMDTSIVIIAVLILVTLVYSAASGVHGVVWTDLFEVLVALFATYMLLTFIFIDMGGPIGLRTALESHADSEKLLSLMPTVIWVLIFYIVFAIMEQGNYNPHNQRSFCLKDEREVIYTGLYTGILNFAFRNWPYYICGLAGLFLISDAYLLEQFPAAVGPDGQAIADHEMVFPALVRQYMPIGLMGLMAAGFLSAFMSSFDTNIHNSTSIFTNDIYKAYLAPGRDEHHYVTASRWYMVFITLLASVIGFMVNDILYLFMFAINVVQSVGMVKLLRFVWWRVNIWGELSAQACSVVITTLMLTGHVNEWTRSLLVWFEVEITNDTLWALRTFLIVCTSTTVSVIVILLTPPESKEKLVAFYKRMRPFGFWGPIRRAADLERDASDSLLWLSVTALSMMGSILGLVFAFMGLLLALWHFMIVGAVVAAVSLRMFFVGVDKLYPKGSSGVAPKASG
ncbi:sodium:solute symporter family transporter [Mucisphaera calidilacus]|uniref:Sodium/glucose cotransporter n=1 Tax=Mucisphaera calidilacus TaxID=2527982 RepID=A0A518BUK3_9BACT|nr:hypothetical protein [Mucisphaera calidilacus]QDU70631.1 Sodium/glucose cotransporter [Mucisphaera calidilacus]